MASLKVLSHLLMTATVTCLASSEQNLVSLEPNADPTLVTRGGKSLLGTFPFNAHAVDDLNEHESQHLALDNTAAPALPASQALDARDAKQGLNSQPVSFSEVAEARPNRNGQRCIDKVEMVEETEYDDTVQCDHSYDRRCHQTFVTQYESQQEEECEENFRKNCFIEYEKIAFNETARICREPLVKDCDRRGEEICRTEYESECWTKQEEHDVQDDVVECRTEVEERCKPNTSGYTTTTQCSKWPREVCRSVLNEETCSTKKHAQPNLKYDPQGVKEVGEEVHSHHWLHKRASGDLRPCWLRLQEGSVGVLRQSSDCGSGRPKRAV